MKYKAFLRTDGFYSITNQDNGQTLDLVIPNKELADKTCIALNDVYKEGMVRGHDLVHGQ